LYAALNQDITGIEVEEALKQALNGKSTADGYAMELWKYAKVKDEETHTWNFMFVPMLVMLFNAVFKSRTGIPEWWRKMTGAGV
jgi:hypothetical protein